MTTTVAVRERPILFSGPMVRAILDRRKTQTRRVIEPQPYDGPLPGGKYLASAPFIDTNDEWHFMRGVVSRGEDDLGKCRYGKPGDRLWVRETHALDPYDRIVYRADRAAQYVQDFAFGGMGRFGHMFWLGSDYEPDRWRPSIHMPRWASRLTLEITDVRVERVQDISIADIEREGYDCGPWPKSRAPEKSARERFSDSWDALNAKRGYGWNANPWVWCLTFKVVQ